METPTAPYSDASLSENSQRLGVVSLGDEVPVLVIHHALGSFAQYSNPETGDLAQWLTARGCQVIGFDLDGHAASASPRQAFPDDHLQRCVDDACTVIGEVGAFPLPVIGIGFGGLVALRLAADLGELVQCVVADSPSGLCPGIPFEPWDLPRSGATIDEQQRLAWREFTATSRLSGIFPEPQQVRCPVLITVCGDALAPDALAGVYEWSRAQPAATVAVLPGAKPPACWEAPSYFVREIERFLAGYA